MGRLLQWTADFFQKKSLDTPRLEAEILLAAAMQVKRIELYTRFDSEPSEAQRAQFREFVKRRGTGEPVAYLVGHKEFYSIPFQVDRNVLIPRPETEQLVLETLDILQAMPAGSEAAICDVGTGSGAITIALAVSLSNAKNRRKNTPNSMVAAKLTAVDLSEPALAVARRNAEKNGVADKIEFVHSDLLQAVTGPFDMIVSNPPYVSQAEYDALSADVKNFEPQSALLAGPKGTEIMERLVQEAAAKLKPGGYLLLEGSPMIADAMETLLHEHQPQEWSDVRILKDTAGLRRFAITRKS